MKKSNNNNRRVTHAEVEKMDSLAGAMKSGKGTKTCVDLQYHPKPEYEMISPTKKKEFAAWKKSNGGTFDPQTHG